MKLCKDCFWFVPIQGMKQVDLCSRSPLYSDGKPIQIMHEPVYGIPVCGYAALARLDEGVCGPEAKLFDPKPMLEIKLYDTGLGRNLKASELP